MEAMLQERESIDVMESVLQPHHDFFHFERQRLNHLFAEAVRYPLIMVSAGAGYGKTSAVFDFIDKYQATTTCLQLSERDNVGARFWENYIHALAQTNLPFCSVAGKLGFPDTTEKFNQYQAIVKRYLPPMEKRILLLDDVHVLHDPSVIRFIDKIINNPSIGTTLILISRSTPRLNLAGMDSKGRVFNVSEGDLRFTESELAQYFHRLEMNPRPENLREIMQDTEGWAFALNLIARSYQKAPGYGGYLRNAMKMKIFRVMETEIWDGISEYVQRFLVRLSLIDHLSFELIEILAGGDEELIEEMERQNAYMRRDSYINAYLIHPLFLDFLTTKQQFLSEEEKRETYAAAGEWCNRSGFKIDALSYYEKIGDYRTIIAILYGLPAQLPPDIAKYGMAIFDRAPAEAFDTVVFLALTHVRCCMRLGLWQRAGELAEYYEAKFLNLPEEDTFRNVSLGGMYLLMGYLRNFLCLGDDVYDFDSYLEKFSKCLRHLTNLNSHSCRVRLQGPWVNAAGSSKKGAPEEYIKAVSRAEVFMPYVFSGFMAGEGDLARGELKFFQGDLPAAEAFFTQAIGKARENRQFEILHRALLYSLRLSIVQGNYTKAEQAIKDTKAQLKEAEYSNRHINHNISMTWYYCILGMPEETPEWLKQNFSSYSHASYSENFENQAKARYFYSTRDYPPLLAYIREMMQRESYLLGRVEMLAMEACVHYKMKDKTKAFEVLREAYETASPNNLIMPFIELGKDMRTLAVSAMKEGDPGIIGGIPGHWLEEVSRKAASYAKRQAHVIAEYRQANRLAKGIALSPREADILKDLSLGLSRAETAVNRGLSINTVKTVINNIYSKMGAENVADLIRIAMERKMI